VRDKREVVFAKCHEYFTYVTPSEVLVPPVEPPFLQASPDIDAPEREPSIWWPTATSPPMSNRRDARPLLATADVSACAM